MPKVKHPQQPIVIGRDGVKRFKKNEIIDWLFKSGKFNLNEIATLPFSKDDHSQLAQLLGYSLCAYNELPYGYIDPDSEVTK